MLDSLARATSDRLRHGRVRAIPRAQRGHEFVACGWARFTRASEPSAFRPYLALVTNLRDVHGNLLVEPANDCVFLWRTLERGEPGFVWVSGQPFEPDPHQALLGAIGATVNHPERMAEALIAHIRDLAGRNRAVGRGVLLNSLPRAAVRPEGPGTLVLAAGPLADTPTFLSVSRDASDPVQCGPIVVSGTGTIMSGFVADPRGSVPGFPPVVDPGGAES